MQKQLTQTLASLPYITTQDLATLLGSSNEVARTTASRWCKQDRLIRLKKGVYISKEFALTHQHHLNFTNLLANIIQPSSYLSLEYVLQDNGILSDAT